MLSREHAEMLLAKAAQGEFTLKILMEDSGSPDEVIGFHAQQAIEKMLKAVLSAKSIHYRRTHDLVELIDLLRENGVEFSDKLDEVRLLGPFATTFRYNEIPPSEEEPFEREWAMDCVRRIKEWTIDQIG